MMAIVREANGTVTLSRLALGWTLQEANDVTGLWTSAASQTSPVNLTPSAAKKFYRLIPILYNKRYK